MAILAKSLRSSRAFSMAFVILVVVALVGMLFLGLAKKGTAKIVALEGKTAPDFTLQLYDGGSLTLSELKGRPVMVHFWASWCSSCREEAPDLEKVWREYKDRGVVFIGVDVQDKESDARAFLTEFDVTYPNGPDTSNRISVSYGLTGVPEATFVNRDGMAVHNHIGPMTPTQMRSYVDDILR